MLTNFMGFQDNQCSELVIQDGQDINYNDLNNNYNKQQDFIHKLRTDISLAHNVPIADVQILSLKKGSIRVEYIVKGAAAGNSDTVVEDCLRRVQQRYPNNRIELKVKPIFDFCNLTADDFEE